MLLEPRADHGVPGLTARVVRAAFPKGTLAVRIREALGPLLRPHRGHRGLTPRFTEFSAESFRRGGNPISELL
jgi:hypothetical protein